MSPESRSTITHLECSKCGKTHPHDQLQNLCTACGKPLLARYDLKAAANTLTREALAAHLTGQRAGAKGVYNAVRFRSQREKSVRGDHMKTRTILLTLATLFVAAVVCFAADAQIGTWKLNEAKSKLAPGT